MLDRCLYDTAQAFISFPFLSNRSVHYGQSGAEDSSYEGRILLFKFSSIYLVYFGALLLGAYTLVTKMAPLSSFNDSFVLIKIPVCVCACVCTCVYVLCSGHSAHIQVGEQRGGTSSLFEHHLDGTWDQPQAIRCVSSVFIH